MWWSRRWFRIAVFTVVGGGAGAALYGLNRIDSGYALTAVGAALGAIAAVGADFYRRTARLTEVRISVPQFSELTFVVNDETEQVSWQLFIESATRTATQKLDDGEGLIREALNSLYSLFATTREILRNTRPSRHTEGLTVEYLAVSLLNRELRPFLSKWHPRLAEFESAHPELPETAWPLAQDCRAELDHLRTATRQYVLGFAQLAGVQNPELMIGGLDVVGLQAPAPDAETDAAAEARRG